MRFVTMDDEGRDLLEAAGEMAHAALDARAKRRDPDEIISRSVEMSRIKTAQLLDQLRQPPLATWKQLGDRQRELFLAVMSADFQDWDDQDYESAFQSIRAICLSRAPHDPAEKG
jgi:hypothetical protein